MQCYKIYILESFEFIMYKIKVYLLHVWTKHKLESLTVALIVVFILSCYKKIQRFFHQCNWMVWKWLHKTMTLDIHLILQSICLYYQQKLEKNIFIISSIENLRSNFKVSLLMVNKCNICCCCFFLSWNLLWKICVVYLE